MEDQSGSSGGVNPSAHGQRWTQSAGAPTSRAIAAAFRRQQRAFSSTCVAVTVIRLQTPKLSISPEQLWLSEKAEVEAES